MIAASFARIFYRNAINIGPAHRRVPGGGGDARSGDRLRVTSPPARREPHAGKPYKAEAFPPFMQDLIDRGGLMPYVKARLEEQA